MNCRRVALLAVSFLFAALASPVKSQVLYGSIVGNAPI
jgi:hypothetical protein